MRSDSRPCRGPPPSYRQPGLSVRADYERERNGAAHARPTDIDRIEEVSRQFDPAQHLATADLFEGLEFEEKEAALKYMREMIRDELYGNLIWRTALKACMTHRVVDLNRPPCSPSTRRGTTATSVLEAAVLSGEGPPAGLFFQLWDLRARRGRGFASTVGLRLGTNRQWPPRPLFSVSVNIAHRGTPSADIFFLRKQEWSYFSIRHSG